MIIIVTGLTLVKGRERHEGYVEALGRRLARGRKPSDEIVHDVAESSPRRNEDQDM